MTEKTKLIAGLLEELKDGNWYVRSSAARALGQLGVASPEVTAGWLEALSDEDIDVVYYAEQALRSLTKGVKNVFADKWWE